MQISQLQPFSPFQMPFTLTPSPPFKREDQETFKPNLNTPLKFTIPTIAKIIERPGWEFHNLNDGDKPKHDRKSLSSIPDEKTETGKTLRSYPSFRSPVKVGPILKRPSLFRKILFTNPLSESNTYKINPNIKSGGYSMSLSFEAYTKDLTERWYKRATKDLNKLSDEIIDETLQNLINNEYAAEMGTSNAYYGDPKKSIKKHNIKMLIAALADGWVFPSIPQINYVSHYASSTNGKYHLDDLSTQTLRMLCLRIGHTTMNSFYKSREYCLSYLHYHKPIFNKSLIANMTLRRLVEISKYHNFVFTLNEEYTRKGYDVISQQPVRRQFFQAMTLRCKIDRKPPQLRTYLVDMSESYDKVQITPSTFLSTSISKGKGLYSDLNEEDFLSVGNYKRHDFGTDQPRYGRNHKYTTIDIVNAIVRKEELLVPLYVALYSLTMEEVGTLVKKLGFSRLVGNVDDFFQIIILCYESIFDINIIYRLRDICHISQESFQSSLSKSKLQEFNIHPDTFSDRVATLWLFGTHTQVPFKPISDRHRYLKLASLPKKVLINMSRGLYDGMSIKTPLRTCSYNKETIIENLYVLSMFSSIGSFIKNTKFLVPPDGMKDEDINEYFIENVKDYIPIFERPENFSFPTNIHEMSYDELRRRISMFTDHELLQYANLDSQVYESRGQLIETFVNTLRGVEERWSLDRDLRHTVNAVYNITTLEERDYNNPDDPIVSYGTKLAYRSYNLSDLDGSFSGYKEENEREEGERGVIVFYNPTYSSSLVEDNIFNGKAKIDNLRILSDFTVYQLGEFIKTLYKPDNSPTLTSTLDSLMLKIDNGLKATTATNSYYQTRINEYRRLSAQDMDLVINFYFQMFTLSMFARFWSGPGNDFPYKFVERGLDNDYSMGKVENTDCYVNIAQRDTNYTRESITLNRIFNTNPGLPDTIRDIDPVSLPAYNYIYGTLNIDYDWVSGTSDVTNHRFIEIFAESTKAAMCLLDLSDRGLKTSYIYLTKIIGLTHDDFNAGLKSHLDEMDGDVHTFIPHKMVGTGHIDPQHGVGR